MRFGTQTNKHTQIRWNNFVCWLWICNAYSVVEISIFFYYLLPKGICLCVSTRYIIDKIDKLKRDSIYNYRKTNNIAKY